MKNPNRPTRSQPNESGKQRSWKNVKEACDLCNMDKKTDWHLETPQFVMADTLHGTPFIVSKTHEKELPDERRELAEKTVATLYDDFELRVLMNIVTDHWHAHIIPKQE